MNLALPPVAVAAWWGTAWLRGRVDTPAVVEAFEQISPVHTVEDRTSQVPQAPEPGPRPGTVGASPTAGVEELLLHLGQHGATGLGIALPVEGDLLGLGGPPELNAAALDAGGALLSCPATLAAVGWTVGAGTTWTLLPARRRQLPDVGEADRALRRATLEGAQRLADLDVARWSPEAADALMDLRNTPDLEAPPGTPPPCLGLAARGLVMESLTQTALADHGGAVSVREITARRDALQELSRHARRALVAACSADAWPDA